MIYVKSAHTLKNGMYVLGSATDLKENKNKHHLKSQLKYILTHKIIMWYSSFSKYLFCVKHNI